MTKNARFKNVATLDRCRYLNEVKFRGTRDCLILSRVYWLKIKLVLRFLCKSLENYYKGRLSTRSINSTNQFFDKHLKMARKTITKMLSPIDGQVWRKGHRFHKKYVKRVKFSRWNLFFIYKPFLQYKSLQKLQNHINPIFKR